MSTEFKEPTPGQSTRKLAVDGGILTQLGEATTAIFLLRDYEKFGLTERVCYHLDLTEALAVLEEVEGDVNSTALAVATTGDKTKPTDAASRHKPITCGVASLLECAPLIPWHRLSKRQKRALRNQLRSFNLEADRIQQSKSVPCYQPKQLPLRLSPSTRMFFAYEVTRIAFCVDASPSMTSTFGVDGTEFTSASPGPCCPLDRLPEMAKTFFESLVEPVSAPSLAETGIWRPVLAVTVIAVFPLGKKAETSLLVRDYRVDSVEAARKLTGKIEKWLQAEVEVGISERLIRRHEVSTWSIPLYSSSLRDILEAGDYALSVLSSDARPLIVVATDGRSVSCDGIVDVFLDIDRVDIPVIILDLSLTGTHAMEDEIDSSPSSKTERNFLSYDPGGPSDFPLHLSDDTEALFRVCTATGGCFLDSKLLNEKSKSVAGQQVASEAPTPYHYSYKRRFVKMNGVQWLTLFSLSPLSPTFQSSSGKLSPPVYLQKRLNMGMVAAPIDNSGDVLNFSRHDSFSLQSPEIRRNVVAEPSLNQSTKKPQTHSRTTFSTYFVSPVRIKALLVMRIKEGYRAKQYGTSTKEFDKVFIQFTLPLDMGIVLHYEISYKALSNQNHMVGSAHIKIELSGDPAFVQAVKGDFLRQGQELRPFTMAQKISSRLCQVMRWIRREDILQSYLSPPSNWSDQLASPESPFARRLGSMTVLQRRRHFRSDEFDVICTGQMPYAQDDGFLSDFVSVDSGEQELIDFIAEWSTQSINKEKSRYVKTIEISDRTTIYCLLEVRRAMLAPRLFTITLEFYGGSDPRERLNILAALKAEIDALKDVEVLSKQMGPFLVGTSHNSMCRKSNVDFQYHHAKWDLVKDPELLPLVMKRRTEIGRFRLMQSNDDSAIFAKVVPEQIHDIPGDLIQYQIAILPDKVVVDLHMESECGLFFPFGLSGGEARRFNGMVQVLRRRDQECGRALRSRTNLLKAMQVRNAGSVITGGEDHEEHRQSVKRMLQYSSRVSKRLRFFNSSARGANEVLTGRTESLLLSGPFGVSAAKLSIGPDERINEEDPGLWFVVQFDRHTMSIVHLSLMDMVDKSDSRTYRNLTFFTSGISDLYSKRDDMNDDDSVNSHISEYFYVTEFIEDFEAAEKENFATAAYLALRKDPAAVDHFEENDFIMVQDSIEFVQVASVLVAGHGFDKDETLEEDGESKLTRLIQTILSPVPGDRNCLFYSGGEINDETFSLSDDESDDIGTQSSMNDSDDHLLERNEDGLEVQRRSSNEDTSDSESQSQLSQHPIFVRFKLDGKPVSFSDLNNIERSTDLAAEISILKREGVKSSTSGNGAGKKLPWSHEAVAAEISVLLKWYVAEQTIERFRDHGPSISEGNLSLVKKCMKRVQSVLSFSIEIYFYVSKTDLMVPASAPAGGQSEVGDGFGLLFDALCNDTTFKFNPVQSGGFFVSSTTGNSLAFWCFLYVRRTEGLVSSQIYHPEGEQMAVGIMSRVHEAVRSCIHRVNQQLLLKSLHRNRTASSFLIPKPTESVDAQEQNIEDDLHGVFFPGSFVCPVVFRTLFNLFHRCATNPSQVARSLEATVLHSFAVSNRSGIFVYKDESGSIFYMSLEARGSGIDGDGQVELLVHGIHRPGPSVTEQLKALLQRRILLIAVDMLSSVLTKNPHFKVSSADLDFLRSFDDEWSNLDKDRISASEQECFFEFPDVVKDPCMILLMFRQNLCGSTFFHRLNDIGHDQLSPSITESERLESGGSVLRWNQHDFTLYYNNAPSKLDQSFQGVSTLTEKGAALSRQVGTGIAMIEVLLVRGNGTPLDDVVFAQPALDATCSAIDRNIEDLRLRRLEAFPTESNRVCVRVRVTDTALSRGHLHEWIELTLNQALTAWVVERGIERSLSSKSMSPMKLNPTIALFSTANDRRDGVIDEICPGLPSFAYILDTSYDLPHPAVSKIEKHGVIRSSTVSAKTLELLEICIFGTLYKDAKPGQALARAQPDLRTIRISRSGPPELVRLSWDVGQRKAMVHAISKSGNERIVYDTPIDCPEYICFYQLGKFKGIGDIEAGLQLYKEVMIHDGISDRSPSIELLETLKDQNRTAFMRSFAFVFSVKRNRRSLRTYNWNPKMVKSVEIRLNESEHSYLEEVGHSAHTLQFRSLRILSPPTKVKQSQSKPEKKTKHLISRTSPQRPNMIPEGQDSSGSTPTRRIRRPVMIRRPKLIGKSVDGAALQAVAASRKRASSNQFKNVPGTAPSGRSSNVGSSRDGGRGNGGKSRSNASDASSKKLGRPPTSSRRPIDRHDQDENVDRIKQDFKSLCMQQSWQLRSRSSQQRMANLVLFDLWWPREIKTTIPVSVAEFLISRSPVAWSDACLFPIFPDGMADAFVPIFARWIETFTPGLNLLPVVSPSMTKNNSILLSSTIKNVRGRKCLAVVKISKAPAAANRKRSLVIRCQGWVGTLSRRSKKHQLKKLDSNVTSSSLLERDSIGLDKLSTDVHSSLALESLLFDFSASLVERAVRLMDERIDSKELIPTLRGLLARYPLEQQKRMPMLNYRVFEAHVVLRSFKNKMIDKFDSLGLMQGLRAEAVERDLMRCGAGLCFMRGINVKGSHSLCFLTPDPAEAIKVRLIILCRTQGRNLSDYMFREGSNVAIHILDNIVYEAAEALHEELSSVSEKLHKDTLWKSLSSRGPRQRRRLDDIQETLELCHVKHILESLGNNATEDSIRTLTTLLGKASGIDWRICCRCMKKQERSFGPSYSIQGEIFDTYLFYVEAGCCFLRLEVDKGGTLQRADVVEREDNTALQKREMAIELFANYLLQFIWRRL